MLRSGLSSLPRPKNDYEIVVPENEEMDTGPAQDGQHVEDQADVDDRRDEELAKQRQYLSRIDLSV